MAEKGQIRIALAGNPNCGKTTMFNNITGAKQHVGNYAGVTVEKKEGYKKFDGHELLFIDLPGTYSLTARSLDELVGDCIFCVVFHDFSVSGSTFSLPSNCLSNFRFPCLERRIIYRSVSAG